MGDEMCIFESMTPVMEVKQMMVFGKRVLIAAALVIVAAGMASAQVRADEAEQIRIRQRISTFETVLQRAIVNGADNVIAQVRAVIPDRPRLGPSRISGFKL